MQMIVYSISECYHISMKWGPACIAPGQQGKPGKSPGVRDTAALTANVTQMGLPENCRKAKEEYIEKDTCADSCSMHVRLLLRSLQLRQFIGLRLRHRSFSRSIGGIFYGGISRIFYGSLRRGNDRIFRRSLRIF